MYKILFFSTPNSGKIHDTNKPRFAYKQEYMEEFVANKTDVSKRILGVKLENQGILPCNAKINKSEIISYNVFIPSKNSVSFSVFIVKMFYG